MNNIEWRCCLCNEVIPRDRVVYRLNCIECRRFYHIDCLDMTKDEYFEIKREGGRWECESCRLALNGSLPSFEDTPSAEVLTIKSVDFNYHQNGKMHRTDRFDLMRRHKSPDEATPKLVVRRGQPFKLKLSCSRPFDREKDAISLIFTVADIEKPHYGNGTLVGTALKDNPREMGDAFEWSAAVDSVHGDILEILIKPAVTAAVTKWNVDIDTKLYSGGAKSFSLPTPIYVLFNPWCSDDAVYMEDRDHLDEYVMADTTLLWRGSYNRLRPSVWKCGQWERDILDSALLVISKIGKVGATHRGDAVKISRALSAAVNSVDDEGVLFGNWSNDFSGGTAPTKWLGSVEILQQFYKKQKPVKYGQCWVFAGVLTTICRAIGIPSRIITNYASAHDTQSSLTVDYFIDDRGTVVEEMNNDSIWNYHVWNEVWMARPELGVGPMGSYGGWQAVDATPQEPSDGMYRCGPASVVAVKFGEVLQFYDCNFLYAEVNADKVYWKYTGPAQPLKLLRKDILGIGNFISTKAVGRWEREDVTSTYKFEEKTTEERDTMLKALRQANSAFSRYYLNEEFNDIYFNFQLLDDIKIGETFTVQLEIKNRSSEKAHTVSGALHVETCFYTGRHREEVKVEKFEVVIEPEATELCEMQVEFDEYFKHLMDQSAFNISCMASVKDTEYEYFAQDDFRVRKPDIKIKFQGEPTSKEPVDVILRLENPLPMALTKGLFHVEGPGLEKAMEFKIQEIPIGGTGGATFKYTPPYSGRASLVAKFYCRELDDVDGFTAFDVKPRAQTDVYVNGNDISNEITAHTDTDIVE